MPFQTGQSGNPKGRSGRDKFITQQMIAELKACDGAKLRKVVIALIDKAIEGDIPAIREVIDRAEGRAPQPIEHEGEVNHVHHGATELLAGRIAGLAARIGARDSDQVVN